MRHTTNEINFITFKNELRTTNKLLSIFMLHPSISIFFSGGAWCSDLGGAGCELLVIGSHVTSRV